MSTHLTSFHAVLFEGSLPTVFISAEKRPESFQYEVLVRNVLHPCLCYGAVGAYQSPTIPRSATYGSTFERHKSAHNLLEQILRAVRCDQKRQDRTHQKHGVRRITNDHGTYDYVAAPADLCRDTVRSAT